MNVEQPSYRLLAALGLGAGLALPMAVGAEVEVYGQANLGLSYLDDGDDYSAANIASHNSRIGIRAGHDFADDFRGLAQIEGQVNFDNDENLSLSSRNTFLGATGSWGLARAGFFDTPTKVIGRQADLFGNQLGDSRNITRGDYSIDGVRNQRLDERFKNSVAYATPDFGGVSGEVHYSVDTRENSDSADSNRNDAFSAAVGYQAGPAYAAIGYERWSFARDVETDSRNLLRAAGYYDLGDLRLVAFAQRATGPNDKVYGAGLRYRIAPSVFLKTQYYRLDADDSDFDADLFAAGVDYHFRPNLRFHLNVAQLSNDELQDLAPWREGNTRNRRGAADETARAVEVGTSFRF